MTIELTLPFPPSMNAYIRHSKGMHFPTAKAKQFRRDVQVLVQQEHVKPMLERLHVTVRLYAPTRQQRDIDNYCKPLLDALQLAGCYLDDEQIDTLLIERGPITKGGGVTVLIIAHENQVPWSQQLPLVPVRERTVPARDAIAEMETM